MRRSPVQPAIATRGQDASTTTRRTRTYADPGNGAQVIKAQGCQQAGDYAEITWQHHDGVNNFDCTYTTVLHEANGRIQYDHSTVVCT
jgi:hypothetical protein